MLAFSPLLEEDNQTSDNHLELIEFVLELFGKDVSDVICLVGDNCNTNKALADLCDLPLVGCAAHRFNLAVQDYLEIKAHNDLLVQVIICHLFSILSLSFFL